MFCPNCGAERPTEKTQFCVTCGRDLVESSTAFLKGIKQGLILFAIGALLIPIWMFMGAAFPPNDRLVESAPSTTAGEAIAWVLMWMAFIASVARLGYATIFQRNVRTENAEKADSALPGRNFTQGELPAGDTFEPASSGKWKTTSELKVPAGFSQKTSGEL